MFNFFSFLQKKLKLYKKVSEKREDFCDVIMPFKDTKIFEFSQYQKSDKAPFCYLECIIEKTDGCKNNSENSSTTKVSKHIPSDFSMSTISLLVGWLR